jgi:hypothetical protein
LPLLTRKPDLDNQYSSSDERFDKKIDDALDAGAINEIGDDLLAELEMGTEVETTDELMAALDSFDPDDSPSEPAPAPAVDDWLIDVRELARKHGPFAPWQIVQIIRTLNSPDNETGR